VRDEPDTQSGIEPDKTDEENHYLTIVDINMVVEINAAQIIMDAETGEDWNNNVTGGNTQIQPTSQARKA